MIFLTPKQERWLTVFACILTLILLCCIPARCTTVSGTVKVNGQPFTGTMTVQLSYPGTTGSYLNLPAPSSYRVSNGSFGSITLDGNDVQLPQGTYYMVSYIDPYGSPIARLPYVITGTTFDLGAAVPLPVTTNNLNFLDLLGIRNMSVQNLTLTNAITIGTAPVQTTYSATGVAGAQSINGVLFAQNYRTGSSTCGLQEAQSALPASGGWIIAPIGSCTLTSPFNVTKSIHLVGYGSGGYADSSTFTTFAAMSTLINGTGTGMITVTPGAVIPEVDLSDLMLDGNNAADNLLVLGGPTGNLSSVYLTRTAIVRAGSNGIVVGGSVTSLHISDSNILSNGGSGVAVNPVSGTTLSILDISTTLIFANGGSGVSVASAGGTVSKVSIRASRLDNNGADGVLVSTPSTLIFDSSVASTNTTAGIALTQGSGHIISNSQFLGNGRQTIGVMVQIAAASSTTQATLLNDIISGSTSGNDVSVLSPTSYVLYYPQATQASVVFDPGSVVHYILPVTTTLYQSIIGAGCTTTGSSYDICSVTLTWPHAFADNSYGYSCSALDTNVIGGGSSDALTATVSAHSTTTITVVIQTQRSNTASPSAISCVGIHN